MLRVAIVAFAALATAASAAPGHSQRLSAGTVIVRLEGSDTGPLLGYEIALRPVEGGFFAAWQDARATGVRRTLLCTPDLPQPDCSTDPADTEQRIRNLTVGYVLPFANVAGWTAAARPQIGWTFVEGSRTSRTLAAGTTHDRASARLGAGIEFGSRPLVHERARLHLGGELAMAFSRGTRCLDCSLPGWAGTMSSASLHAGASFLVR